MDNKGADNPFPPAYAGGDPGFSGAAMGFNPPLQGYSVQPPPHTMQPQSSNTTVIINQPTSPGPARLGAWSYGLFSCFDDCGICLCVTCLPWCAACQMVSDMGENMCIVCCVHNWEVAARTKLRTQLGIHGSIFDDCCVTAFCGSCALCQMMREVKQAKAQGKM